MTTKSNISLADFAEKGADVDLLRDMIQFVAQRMMDMDTEGVCARQNCAIYVRRLQQGCAPDAAHTLPPFAHRPPLSSIGGCKRVLDH